MKMMDFGTSTGVRTAHLPQPRVNRSRYGNWITESLKSLANGCYPFCILTHLLIVMLEKALYRHSKILINPLLHDGESRSA